MNSVSLSPRSFSLCLAVTLIAVFASAQSSSPSSMSSRIVQPVDDAARTTLKGTTPKAIKTAHDLGAADGGHPLQRMMLVLTSSPDQRAALRRLIENQHN